MTAYVTIRGPHVTHQNANHRTHKKFLQKTYSFMFRDLTKRLEKTRLVVYK